MSETVNVTVMVGYNSHDLGERDNVCGVSTSWQEFFKVVF